MSVCQLDLDKIAEWKDHCLSHEISTEELLKIDNGTAPKIGDRNEHILYAPVGFRFVFSIEYCPSLTSSRIYKMRRLSGSLNKPEKYPTPKLMGAISQILGFGPLEKCIVKLNDQDPIPNIEINEIIEIIDKL
jgi:hypothetical protein